MAVRIQWQPPLVLEARKRAQWERIIHSELGDVGHPLDVSLRFEEENLRWRVETASSQASGAKVAAHSRGRLVEALRAAGKPVA